MERSSRQRLQQRTNGFGEYEDESQEPEIFRKILDKLDGCIYKLQSGKMRIELKDSEQPSGRRTYMEGGEPVYNPVGMRSLNSVSIPDSYMVKRF